MPWLKGNLHTHTNLSDGDSPPGVVARWYDDHAYDFLIISDHNVRFPPAELQKELRGESRSLLLIPGEELSTWWPGPDRTYALHVNGYGTSSGSANVRPDRDVAAAAAELRRRGARKVILVGASMGGTGVVAAAPGIRPAVSGVVDLSGPVGFGGVNALPAARKLRRPALFVVGRDDGDFAAATRALYRAAATKDKELVIAPTSWHGVDLVSLPAVKRVVLEFIGRVGG